MKISERGIDEYGTYADLHISTGYGKATQRMRWIEPGTFLMGSPDGAAERWSDEGPQHSVTLTKGFWLADTACTQALWQAVMGNNPSYFRDNEQNPVENVSWNDVQEFLRTIETLLPGVEACLPTEAQWEYACRAGTTTPFSFGNQITPKQANYDGDFPYADGKEGEYRGHTLPVKSLPANAWGLYEMHGNVGEWCTNDLHTYDTTPRCAARACAGSTSSAARARLANFIRITAFRQSIGDDPILCRALTPDGPKQGSFIDPTGQAD